MIVISRSQTYKDFIEEIMCLTNELKTDKTLIMYAFFKDKMTMCNFFHISSLICSVVSVLLTADFQRPNF